MPWPRFPLFVVVSSSRPQMRRIYGMDLTFTARNVIFILLNKNFYYNHIKHQVLRLYNFPK
jgi:hypothetical protein